MYYLVYKITNKINGKYYIGKHETSNKDDGYLGSGKLIIAAVKKYGAENFTKEILHECNDSLEMYRKEYDLIVPNKIDSQSYNISAKDYGPQFGNDDRTKEIGKRGSDKLLELLENDEDFRNNFSEQVKAAQKRYKERHGKSYWENKKHKQESKDKIGMANSISQAGERNSQYGTKWISNPITKEYKRILKTENIPEGWIAGRKGYTKGAIEVKKEMLR